MSEIVHIVAVTLLTYSYLFIGFFVLVTFVLALARLATIFYWLKDRHLDDRYGWKVHPTKRKWCRIGVHNWRYLAGEHRWSRERVCSNCDERHVNARRKEGAIIYNHWIRWAPETQQIPRAKVRRIE